MKLESEEALIDVLVAMQNVERITKGKSRFRGNPAKAETALRHLPKGEHRNEVELLRQLLEGEENEG